MRIIPVENVIMTDEIRRGKTGAAQKIFCVGHLITKINVYLSMNLQMLKSFRIFPCSHTHEHSVWWQHEKFILRSLWCHFIPRFSEPAKVENYLLIFRFSRVSLKRRRRYNGIFLLFKFLCRRSVDSHQFRIPTKWMKTRWKANKQLLSLFLFRKFFFSCMFLLCFYEWI